MTDSWISLATITADDDIMASNLVMINDKELITSTHLGLFKYNIPNNEWTLFMEYTKDFSVEDDEITISINECKTKIYLSDSHSAMKIIDLETKTFKTQHKTLNGKSAECTLNLMVNDEFHLFGGYGINQHYIWNEHISSFEKVYEFDEYENGLTHFRVIHVKSQNILLLFGGFKHGVCDNHRLNNIYSHVLGTKKWIKLPQTMSNKMNSFGIIKTFDEKYVITFGGYDANFIVNIDIIELKSFKSVRSSIEVPLKGFFHAILSADCRLQDEILIFGFIRLYLGDNKNMPKEIINMIVSWYSIDFVYLLEEEGRFFKININDILYPAINTFQLI